MLLPLLLAAVASAQQTVLVLPVELLGELDSAVTPELVDEALLTAIQAVSNERVLGPSDLEAALRFQQRPDLRACDAEACFVEMAGALDATRLVATKITRAEGRWTVSTKVIALATGAPQVLARRVETIAGNVDKLLAGLKALMQTLRAELNLAPPTPSNRVKALLVLNLASYPADSPPPERSLLAAAIVAELTPNGFTFFEPELPARQVPDPRRAARAVGAAVVFVADARSDSLGGIAGTAMLSIRASLSLRVVDVSTGEILAAGSATQTAGHVSAAAGADRALQKAATAAVAQLVSKLGPRHPARASGSAD